MNVFAGTQPPWFPLPPAWRAHAAATLGAILLETAGGLGGDHTSYLFASPERVLRATSAAELLALLDEIESAAQQGFYAVGCIDYEAAYPLHDIPAAAAPRPVACFGLYREALRFDHHTGIADGPALPSAREDLIAKPLLSNLRPQMEREVYGEKFAAVQRFLAAGDTYQVNLTTRMEAELLESPLALYESLVDSQPVDFAAIVHLDESLALSFSPELFFRIEAAEGRRIATRPMKGTAPRGTATGEDERLREWLANDEKNHAEHVMIVDLLRNDLGRICEPGSVLASDLFRIESYPTLFQMTSTVSGALLPYVRFRDIVRALFPSGSITGAPKRRTMEIIRDLEDAPRGVYTGAIGFISPAGDACFSVPIRTLDVRLGAITMGVGGGVVVDSTAEAEYDECLLKASFLNNAASAPQLIETLLWDNGYPLLELHLARLTKSAAELEFRCDPEKVRAELQAASGRIPVDGIHSVRLLLSADGSVTVGLAQVLGPRGDLRLRLAARRIFSGDPWLRHKTTRRAFYNRELARARLDRFDEVLFLNERGELAEGTISSIFVEIDGRLYTPPLSCGALPGVFRQHLFETHPNIAEKTLLPEDLASASAVYVGNALRGLRTVGSLHFE